MSKRPGRDAGQQLDASAPLRVLSVFSGIGGFDLGLEQAGMQVIHQVEFDPWRQAVLEELWPGRLVCSDVRSFHARPGCYDVLAGGPPCQPASLAGKRGGSSDERWMWPEFIRLAREGEFPWFIAENPRGILSLGDGEAALAELEAAGYEVWPLLLGADDVGAPQRRKRVWFIGYNLAYADRRGLRAERKPGPAGTDQQRALGDAHGEHLQGGGAAGLQGQAGSAAGSVGDAQDLRLEGERAGGIQFLPESPRAYAARCAGPVQWPAGRGHEQYPWEAARLSRFIERDDSPVLPGFEWAVGAGPDGLPPGLVQPLGWHNKETLRAAGDAIVPECGRIIGLAVVGADRLLRGMTNGK